MGLPPLSLHPEALFLPLNRSKPTGKMLSTEETSPRKCGPRISKPRPPPNVALKSIFSSQILNVSKQRERPRRRRDDPSVAS